MFSLNFQKKLRKSSQFSAEGQKPNIMFILQILSNLFEIQEVFRHLQEIALDTHPG
jgi:hypothetical protein